MANICDVSLTARGFKTRKDLDSFVQILQNSSDDSLRSGGFWLPFFEVGVDINYDTNTVIAEGWCKWTADRILDSHIQGVKDDNPNITSAEELSAKFGIDIEILGTEAGCEVGEHYLIEGGEITLEDYFDYREYETLESYEAFVEENGDAVDEETWQLHKDEGDEWIPVGEPSVPYGTLWSREYNRLTD